jgi:hypothetical protein
MRSSLAGRRILSVTLGTKWALPEAYLAGGEWSTLLDSIVDVDLLHPVVDRLYCVFNSHAWRHLHCLMGIRNAFPSAAFHVDPERPTLANPKVTRSWHKQSMLLLSVVLCGSYVGSFVDKGWIPHDEGAIGQAAERVLGGELPHRDFDATYTGGLAMMHAVSFRTLGVSILSMRIQAFLFFLAALPTLFYIATRFVSPGSAVAVLVLASAWTLPMYPASMPSWYNLFFAVFAVAALVRWIEVGSARWLLLAGLAVGFSILIKITGLFLLAGIVLFLFFAEQEWSAGRWKPRTGRLRDLQFPSPVSPAPGSAAWSFKLVAWLLLTMLAVVVSGLVGRRMGWLGFASIAVPPIALAGWLAIRVGEVAVPSSIRFRSFLSLLAPVVLGAGIPVAFFLLPYLASGSVDDLARGALLLPSRRLDGAGRAFEPLWTAAPILLGALGLWLFTRVDGRARAFVLGVFVNLVVLWVYLSIFQVSEGISRLTLGIPVVVPVLVLFGLRTIEGVQARPDRGVPERRLGLFLLLAVTALCQLVQIPYGYYLYFFYTGALVAVAASAVLAEVMLARAPVTWVTFGGLLAVSVFGLNGHFDFTERRAMLALPRAGIEVDESHRATYEELVGVIDQHSRSDFIYATPDCPEVYFLSSRRNPTRTLFDLFDEPEGRTSRILEALRARNVNLVVVNRKPDFSGAPTASLMDSLSANYPQSRNVGDFLVLWRSPSTTGAAVSDRMLRPVQQPLG